LKSPVHVYRLNNNGMSSLSVSPVWKHASIFAGESIGLGGGGGRHGQWHWTTTKGTLDAPQQWFIVIIVKQVVGEPFKLIAVRFRQKKWLWNSCWTGWIAKSSVSITISGIYT
jgi:hypothetical protein